MVKESAAATSRLFVAAEITEIGQGSGTVRTQLSMATAIDEQMLREIFPEDFCEERKLFFDSSINRVMWKKEKKYHDLILESMQYDAAPSPEASSILAATLHQGDLPLPTWNEEAEPWIQRLRWLAAIAPEYEIPTFTQEERLLALEQWCSGFVSYREVKDRSPLSALASLLTPAQQAALEKMAPTSYLRSRSR